ncbi:MAG: arsenic resistance N-acetyltransferase ArsN2 [Rhizomicrobium sp.]
MALRDAGLPIDDLGEAGRCFYAYHTLGGTLAGYGGFECYGADVLIRSIVVPEALRGKAIGRNLVALLLYRAFQAGARRAWLLTITAANYFEKIGFKPVARDAAPQNILSTRQAQGLCPVSAELLCRNIGF